MFVISPSITAELMRLQKENPQREVVGFFDTDETGSHATAFTVVSYGDDDKVAFRDFHPYMFHTHPSDPNLLVEEPPSGEDFMQALTWGYPAYNAEQRSSTREVVCSAEGLWHYAASPALRETYFALEEHAQSNLAKALCRYLNVLVTCYKNKLIGYGCLTQNVETIDFSWMAGLLQKNPELLAYVEEEFPLSSMGKLTREKNNCPGFFLELCVFF